MQVVEMKENGVAAAGAGEKAAHLSVKRGEPTLVKPAEPTPAGEQYYLSNLDQNIAVIVQTVYCYKPASGDKQADVAAALRDALARVLVHYHPLAGRLGISKEMKLTVELTGEGAVFVEADAGCDLADVGDLTKPDPAALGQLVYSVPGAKHILEMPPMTAQVNVVYISLVCFPFTLSGWVPWAACVNGENVEKVAAARGPTYRPWTFTAAACAGMGLEVGRDAAEVGDGDWIEEMPPLVGFWRFYSS